MTLTATILQSIDWTIIAVFFLIVLGIGWVASKTAGKSSAEFFLGGRGMPWWLLGISMVACTFSCDTPNLVTQLVRDGGVSNNWVWWAFLLTGMVTVFIYAQLWRRSNVMTDLEFYELRYSGKGASFLRGFRALYLGILFNCLIMGTVSLAAIKIGGVMLGTSPLVTIVGASVFVVIYASLGGIKGVIWSDFFQYGIAMAGAIYASYVAVNYEGVGGLDGLLTHEAVLPKLLIVPELDNWMMFVPMLLIPVAVQWWAVWYPGAEPGGGGYIAQKMLSAKDEKNAIGATMLFNFMHYAVRPWPWIIVALASIIIFPSLTDIKAQFPDIDPKYLQSDIAYPAMLAKILGPGWLGIVVASLIAAYMSTIGTHLNWGSSYVVNDFYKRFVKKDATEKDMVRMGRICTVGLMVFAGFLALTVLDSARKGLDLLFLSGAGTGAIYLLRWFWWRINAITEIVAMIVATVAAAYLVFGAGDDGVKRWFIGSSVVADKVHVVEDPALVKFIQTEQKAGEAKLEASQEIVDAKEETWSNTSKDDKEAREKANVEYSAAYQAHADLKASLSDAALTYKYIEANSPAWVAGLDAFQLEMNKKELVQANHRAEKAGVEAKKLEDISVGLSGLVKGDKVYMHHPDVAGLTFSFKLLTMVAVVTVSWLLGTFLTKPVSKEVLYGFYRQCHPGGPGWKKVLREAEAEGIDLLDGQVKNWQMPLKLLCVFVGSMVIYCCLFSVGRFIYGDLTGGFILAGIAVAGLVFLMKAFVKIKTD